mmetsp:Transcript_71022/g.197286  ORF Transcript_71022/g.197286 Transcript_71022/m.197286 type:complete len:300 (-) Transcript_71022:128-1027(-)
MKKADVVLEELMTDRIPTAVILGYFLSFVAGLAGGLVGGYLGWIYDEGLPPILGGFAGFILMFAVVWAISGPGLYHYARVSAVVAPPELQRLMTTGFRTFDFYVTIHKVQNMYNPDDLIGLVGEDSMRYLFVEVKVGRLIHDGVTGNSYLSMQVNPKNRTTVQTSGVFEECFHFSASPTDNTIRITLFEQDVFLDSAVGYCDIDITDHVLDQGFPQKKAYKLLRELDQGDANRDAAYFTGCVVVSFAPGGKFPKRAARNIEESHKLEFEHLRSTTGNLMDKTKQDHTAYGTWMAQETAV